MESKWFKNVGTENNPVTYLHEYAVALIWDILQAGLGEEMLTGGYAGSGARVRRIVRRSWSSNKEVRVRISPDEMSPDLLDGVRRITIPDSLTPIGGYIPDIALFDESDRPIRVIEVVVTNPPTSDKLESLSKRGVDVVVVSVKSEDDLKNLVWVPATEVNFAFQSGPFGDVIGPHSRDADKRIRQLCTDLQRCHPQLRRQLLDVLNQLDAMDSLYPISGSNPKREALEDAQ